MKSILCGAILVYVAGVILLSNQCSAAEKDRRDVFQAKRINKNAVWTVNAPLERVFPLLCPEKELDWCNDWAYKMIFSESGIAENGCVFETNRAGEGRAIWVITAYEPNQHLQVVKIVPELVALKWDFDLSEPKRGRTEVAITYSMTGLTEQGNNYVENFMNQAFLRLMELLEREAEYYLTKGKKLEL